MKFDEILNSKLNKINEDGDYSHDDYYILKDGVLVAIVTDDAFDAWSTVEGMRAKWQDESNCKVEILKAYQYKTRIL